MKEIIILFIFVFSVFMLKAQIIINTDGTHGIVAGQHVHNSDGSISVIHGNHIINPNGAISVIHGSHILNQNESTSTLTGSNQSVADSFLQFKKSKKFRSSKSNYNREILHVDKKKTQKEIRIHKKTIRKNNGSTIEQSNKGCDNKYLF
ncbi:hypothetical protein [Sphingobacterium kyonggiense]